MIEDIITYLVSQGYNVREYEKNRTRIDVMVEDGSRSNRIKVLKDIQRLFDIDVKHNPVTQYSSIGNLQIGRYKIYVKAANKQHKQSAGMYNEHILLENIRAAIEELGNIDIEFTTVDGSICVCTNVHQVSFGKGKCDLIILGDDEWKISIKKDDAQYWESADSYLGKVARVYLDRLIRRNLLNLTSTNGIYRLSHEVAMQVSRKVMENVVFGKDIDAVIIRSFEENDFNFDVESGILKIGVNKIITSLYDIIGTEFEVWMLIRNDCTRRSVALGYAGLRVLAARRSRIFENKRNLKVMSFRSIWQK